MYDSDKTFRNFWIGVFFYIVCGIFVWARYMNEFDYEVDVRVSAIFSGLFWPVYWLGRFALFVTDF